VFVNRLLKSVYFWAVLGGLIFLFVLTKFNFSKVVKIIKLLGKLGVNLLALFLGLFGIKFRKILDEIEGVK